MNGGSSASGAAMRKQEMSQQQQINQGLSQLGLVFGGGYGTGQAAKYKKGTPYFDAGGQAFSGTSKQAKQLVKQGGLFTGSATSDAFGEDWLNQRRQTYMNYAMPQLGQQAQNQWQQLAYRLGNQGLLKSGAAGRLNSSLQTEIGQQKQNIASQAEDLAQSNRQNVEQQRSNLTSQLLAGASPSTTTQQALATASSANAPSVFAPLGNLFQNWANIYLSRQAATTPQMPSLYGSVASRIPSTNNESGSSYRIVK